MHLDGASKSGSLAGESNELVAESISEENPDEEMQGSVNVSA